MLTNILKTHNYCTHKINERCGLYYSKLVIKKNEELTISKHIRNY